MASEYSFGSEPETFENPVPLDRLIGILGAGGGIPAMVAQPGGDDRFVNPDQPKKNLFHGRELILRRASRNRFSICGARDRPNALLTEIHKSYGWSS
jgi:hypothetical protein